MIKKLLNNPALFLYIAVKIYLLTISHINTASKSYWRQKINQLRHYKRAFYFVANVLMQILINGFTYLSNVYPISTYYLRSS